MRGFRSRSEMRRVHIDGGGITCRNPRLDCLLRSAEMVEDARRGVLAREVGAVQ
jgi:hypothetical protein